MLSMFRSLTLAVAVAALMAPALTRAQINFEKSSYYLSIGDSPAAGEGALPVTHGYVYQLYDRGVFGRTQQMDFGNIAIKGATADEVQLLQVPQVLCIQPPRIELAPSVITLSAGASDFFVYLASGGSVDPLAIQAVSTAIAGKVESIIRSIVFGAAGLPPGAPALPPHCATSGIPGIKILVSNYYSFDHPDPTIKFLLDLALQTFGASLQARLAQVQIDIVANGKTARVGFVDTFSAMDGRQGLLLIERRNGFNGPLDFEIHPTNAGHTVIAQEYAKVWETIQ